MSGQFSEEVVDFAYQNLPDLKPVTELKLPVFTQWGAYPVLYVTQYGDVLCGDCATGELQEFLSEGWHEDPVIAYGPAEESEYDERCTSCQFLLCEGYKENDDD